MGSRERISAGRRTASALAVLSAFLWPVAANGQQWAWTTETVDKAGKATSLAVDRAGNVHISYGRDEGGLKYGFRPAGTSRWFTIDLGVGAAFTDLSLDANDNPHICSTFRKIHYVHFDGLEWHTQEVASETATIQFSCAVAIGPGNTPHLTWYRVVDQDGYAHTRYAVLQNGVWMLRTLDFDMQTGKWHSMVLDSDGNPHISYDAFVKGLLKYAHWDGQRWSVSVVDSRGSQYNIGMGSAILLDAQRDLGISYFTESQLRYARQRNTRWTIQTVDTVSPWGSWVGYRTSVILDRAGFPHIAYEDRGSLKHAYWDGTRWRIQVIAPSGPEPYRFASMAVGRDDTIYISFRDPQDGSVRMAIGRKTEKTSTAALDKQEKK